MTLRVRVAGEREPAAESTPGRAPAAAAARTAERRAPERPPLSLAEVADAEHAHEIIGLVDGELKVNQANWDAFKKSAVCDMGTLVVSFVGDTSAGKSHTIR